MSSSTIIKNSCINNIEITGNYTNNLQPCNQVRHNDRSNHACNKDECKARFVKGNKPQDLDWFSITNVEEPQSYMFRKQKRIRAAVMARSPPHVFGIPIYSYFCLLPQNGIFSQPCSIGPIYPLSNYNAIHRVILIVLVCSK